MANILLVSEEQVKTQSIIERNVDSKVLSHVIWNVQELQLQAILGKELYKSVLDKVKEKALNNTEIDAVTVELLDSYITPFLTYATMVEFLVVNQYKVTNKGVMKMSDNSAQAVTTQDFEYIRNYYENHLATYKANLIEFLKEKGLSTYKTDKNTTSAAIGWYLQQ